MGQLLLAVLPVPVYGRAVQRAAYFLALWREGGKPGLKLRPLRLKRRYFIPQPLYIFGGGASHIPEALLLKARRPYIRRKLRVLLLRADDESRPLLIAAEKLHQRAGLH